MSGSRTRKQPASGQMKVLEVGWGGEMIIKTKLLSHFLLIVFSVDLWNDSHWVYLRTVGQQMKWRHICHAIVPYWPHCSYHHQPRICGEHLLLHFTLHLWLMKVSYNSSYLALGRRLQMFPSRQFHPLKQLEVWQYDLRIILRLVFTLSLHYLLVYNVA